MYNYICITYVVFLTSIFFVHLYLALLHCFCAWQNHRPERDGPGALVMSPTCATQDTVKNLVNTR